MNFLHCQDLPIWAQVLLYPIEAPDGEVRKESSDNEQKAIAPLSPA